MKKIIVLMLAMSMLFSANIFAETTDDVPDADKVKVSYTGEDFKDSAKKQSTAGVFGSESDNVSASGILGTTGAFFSTGALKTDDGTSGEFLAADTPIQGAFAMPINESMAAGIIAEYDMNRKRDDDITASTDAVNSVITEESDFEVLGAFKWENMGFHYRIQREGKDTDTNNKTIDNDGNELGSTTSSVSEALTSEKWEHEIGYAINLPDLMTIYAPIGLRFDNADKTKSEVINNNALATEATSTIDDDNDGKTVELYIYPEVSMPLDLGPMTNAAGGLKFAMNVVDGSDTRVTTTTYGNATDETATYETVRDEVYTPDSLDMKFGIWAKPTLEWDTIPGKLMFVAKPKLSIDYFKNSDSGDSVTTTTTTTVGGITTTSDPVPSTADIITDHYVNYTVDADLGIIATPKPWVEFRTGFAYQLAWLTGTKTTSLERTGGASYSEFDSKFADDFDMYFGVGFTIVDNFEIDIKLDANDVLLYLGELNITATYRF